jgi:anti-sigma B factor antagonist
MKIQNKDAQTSTVTDLHELAITNAAQVRDEIRAALPPDCKVLELDLSATKFLDSSGLGAMVALYKTLHSKKGKVRLLRPSPKVQQVLELTRLHQIFEIVNP